MANSRRKCPNCKAYNKPEDGLLIKNRLYCSLECAVSYGKKNAPKAKAKQDKAARAKLQERKKELRPLKWYADKAQAAFNRYIRLRDKGKPCVSCGKPDDGTHQRHASHYRSRGACSFLRFDEMNVWASCSKCNNHLSGNIEGYTPELIRRIGQDEFDRIMQAPKSRKWTKAELIEIERKYKEMVK